jgi:hypothetical protein
VAQKSFSGCHFVIFCCADQVPSLGETAVSDVCCTCSIFYDGVRNVQ